MVKRETKSDIWQEEGCCIFVLRCNNHWLDGLDTAVQCCTEFKLYFSWFDWTVLHYAELYRGFCIMIKSWNYCIVLLWAVLNWKIQHCIIDIAGMQFRYRNRYRYFALLTAQPLQFWDAGTALLNSSMHRNAQCTVLQWDLRSSFDWRGHNFAEDLVVAVAGGDDDNSDF